MAMKHLILVVVFGLLFVAGCRSFPKEVGESQREIMNRCMDAATDTDLVDDRFDNPKLKTMDYCYNKLSVQQGNFSVCSHIRHEELRDSCVLRYAIGKKDPSLCSGIRIDAVKKQCEVMASPRFIPNATNN